MSKVTLETPFLRFRGKICSHAQIIYKQMYGTNYTSQLCNPYTGELSVAQKEHQAKFKQARANVLALTEEENASYKVQFMKQRKYRTLAGYKFAQELAKLSVIVYIFNHQNLLNF